MGGSKQTSHQKAKTKSKSKSQSQLTPYNKGAVNKIYDVASDAYDAMPDPSEVMAQGQGWLDARGDLLKDQYGKISSLLDPIASGSMIGEDNPYLQGLLSTIQDRTRNDVGSRFAAAGRSFSGAHSGALGKGISEGLAAPLFSNYWNERNAQMNAINQLQSLGFGTAGGYGDQLGLLGGLQGLPFMGAQNYANLILPPSTAFGKNKTKGSSKGTNITVGSVEQADNPFQTAAGIGIGLLGAASDRRLKEDVEEIGVTFDGTPIYRFRYKDHPVMLIGLMADDVEKKVPDAVFVGNDGFKRVDYKAATDAAVRAP
jgi:hypothetical protein